MLNNCNITLDFLDHVLLQWVELGRPLKLKPNVFKDHLLTEKYQQTIQLNYQHWLLNDHAIDIYEMLTILILFARITLDDRLIYLFKLFATQHSLKGGAEVIKQEELAFFIQKLTDALSQVLSLSKTVLKDILNRIRIETLIEGLELNKNEFVGFNLKVTYAISEVVKDLQGHM